MYLNGDNYISYDANLIDNWTIGNELKIKWNGIEYNCVCKEDSNMGENIYGFSVDGKYVMFCQDGTIVDNHSSYFQEGDTHTYEVYTGGITIHKLDKKYLPKVVSSNGKTETELVIGNISVTKQEGSPYGDYHYYTSTYNSPNGLELGVTYKVVVADRVYETICVEYDEGGMPALFVNSLVIIRYNSILKLYLIELYNHSEIIGNNSTVNFEVWEVAKSEVVFNHPFIAYCENGQVITDVDYSYLKKLYDKGLYIIFIVNISSNNSYLTTDMLLKEENLHFLFDSTEAELVFYKNGNIECNELA